MSRQCRIFIDGEAGTTGLGIRDRLENNSGVALLQIEPDQRKNPQARLKLMSEADIVVLCLPDDAAREAVTLMETLGEGGPKIIDASSAFRVSPGWIYGFAEMSWGQADLIRTATRVSNPGCYATGAIALLRPLIKDGLISADLPLSINAVSGYSGGGKTMIADHEAHAGPAFELYALSLEHKHVPEIQFHTGLTHRPLFVPSVGHFRQGMLVSIPLHLDQLASQARSADIKDALHTAYSGSEYVHLRETVETRLEAETNDNNNAVELFVFASEDRGQALLVARLDNLGKGASGAAVQNIALMRETL